MCRYYLSPSELFVTGINVPIQRVKVANPLLSIETDGLFYIK